MVIVGLLYTFACVLLCTCFTLNQAGVFNIFTKHKHDVRQHWNFYNIILPQNISSINSQGFSYMHMSTYREISKSIRFRKQFLPHTD